jgi:dihydroneopterin aldolase
MSLSTGDSLETTCSRLKAAFQPKVILLNHEKRLGTDTACANLAIKYNLIYISVYQLIREHVDGKTAWGKKLALTKRNRQLNVAMQMRDEFAEQDYSAALFDYGLVMALIKDTVAAKRTDQQFVLIEGLFNSAKLADQDAALEMRLMDEFQAVEAEIGEVAAVVGLQLAVEPEVVDEKDIDYIRAMPEEPKALPKDADGNDIQPEPELDADGNPIVKAKWRAGDYDWSITDKKPRNLPQVFLASKGVARCRHEVKASDAYSSSSYEAISKALDEFCMLTRKEANSGEQSMYLYTQVLFSD